MNIQEQFIDRRHFLKLGATEAVMLAIASNLCWRTKPVQAAELPTDTLSKPDAALQKLLEGNQRFTRHQPQYPHQSHARMQELAQTQHPFATVLTCADSRVPVELLFDQGIGDIFDIRVAGNIATPETIGSIEYAVALLGTPVVMVLGHERCGAVTAAVNNNVTLPGEIGSFVEAILPAVAKVKGLSGDAVDNAVIANVHYQIEQLKRSPVLTERLRSGDLKIVGGRYDLDTGTVKILI
ncbi:carbonic anhydrase [Phormidium sp. CLA17]|uniref:carbonic anhydrase n=1 Tax=Leptolyngbya sp. Cla-17 TaxID=2803751 RepID=UPI001490CADD|nr:carbonic anhydrase [Leptolyngbya sp. Cla-17]MBM0742059.1 carbonic anhydrase [Leptolyngbya sp. Cla-17]